MRKPSAVTPHVHDYEAQRAELPCLPRGKAALRGVLLVMMAWLLAAGASWAQPIIETVAGGGVGDGGPATNAFLGPAGVAVVTPRRHRHRVRHAGRAGDVVAGAGTRVAGGTQFGGGHANRSVTRALPAKADVLAIRM